MEDVSKNEGRTVLFVSHNMAAIRALCNRGFFLEGGTFKFQGSISSTIEAYENSGSDLEGTEWINNEQDKYEMYLEKITILDSNSNERRFFLNSERIVIRLIVRANRDVKHVKIGFDLISKGLVVLRTQQIDDMKLDEVTKGHRYLYDCEIPEWFLNTGDFFIRPVFSIHMVKSLTGIGDAVISFNVSIDSSKTFYHSVIKEDNHPGVIFPQLKWVCDDIKNDKTG